MIAIELSFLEPIGGASPKFAHKSKGSILFQELDQSMSLSCPAQGFPVPAFRLVEKHFLRIQIELSFLEPIGGAGPKFAHESKGSILVKELSQAISLSCPAQGFPVPAFRLV